MFRASGGDNLAAIFGPERAERSFLFTNLKEGRGVGEIVAFIEHEGGLAAKCLARKELSDFSQL